ncbi:MAG: GNAT family N-acetyltransferase [Armatimonadota bacterium]
MKTEIVVDKADASLLGDLSAIDEAVIGDGSRRGLIKDAISASQCLYARIDGAIAGFAIFEQSFFGQGFIDLLIVHPDYRQQGVGKAIICYIEEHCPTDKLFTSTNQSNIPMQNLCEGIGFSRSGYIENLDEGDPEIIYFKRIRWED